MKAVFILSILLFVLQLQAETVDTIMVKSKITDVTVFTEGAQVNRQASEKFIKGKHILVFERLPRELEPQSIQVKNISKAQKRGNIRVIRWGKILGIYGLFQMSKAIM